MNRNVLVFFTGLLHALRDAWFFSFILAESWEDNRSGLNERNPFVPHHHHPHHLHHLPHQSTVNTCRATLQSLPLRCDQGGAGEQTDFQNSNFTGWRRRWVRSSWQPIGTEVWSGSVAPPPVQIPPWLWRQYTSTGEHDASLRVHPCAPRLIEAPRSWGVIAVLSRRGTRCDGSAHGLLRAASPLRAPAESNFVFNGRASSGGGRRSGSSGGGGGSGGGRLVLLSSLSVAARASSSASPVREPPSSGQRVPLRPLVWLPPPPPPPPRPQTVTFRTAWSWLTVSRNRWPGVRSEWASTTSSAL